MSGLLSHHHLYAPRLPRLTALNTTQALQSLAEGLSSIFVPIFLYKIGYSLSFIALYLIAFALTWLLALVPAVWLTRYGARPVLVIGLLAGALQFLVLIGLPSNASLIWPVALLGGLTTAFYWLAFRIAFSQALANQSASRNIGLTEALLTLSSGLAPAIGGLIASLWGVEALYIVTTSLFFVAAIPLFFYHQSAPPVFSFSSLWRSHTRSHFAANAMVTIDDAASNIMWPLFIFLLLPSYAGVGLLVSVTLLTAVAASLYAGYHPRGKAPLRHTAGGAIVSAVGNLLRPLVHSGSQVFGANVVTGFGKSLALTPYMVKYYRHIEHEGFWYLVGMQIAAALGCLIYFSSVWLLSLAFQASVALMISLFIAAPLIIGVTRLR